MLGQDSTPIAVEEQPLMINGCYLRQARIVQQSSGDHKLQTGSCMINMESPIKDSIDLASLSQPKTRLEGRTAGFCRVCEDLGVLERQRDAKV